MHITPILSQKIYLIENTGSRWEYQNLTHAADELFRLGIYGPSYNDGGHIGSYHVEKHGRYSWIKDLYESYNVSFQFVVRTGLGDVITISDLCEARMPHKWKWISRRELVKKHSQFRKTPVPFTGRRSWNYLRQLNTMPERRLAEAHANQEMKNYGVKVRAKRNKANLPNSWDNYWRHNTKSWKKHRKHQWKQKK